MLKGKLKEKEKSLREQKNIIKHSSKITKQIIKNLRNETKKYTITAIVAGFGFLIALVWRDTIKEYVKILVTRLSISGNPALVSLYTAIITTLIAVIGIMIITKWGSKPE